VEAVEVRLSIFELVEQKLQLLIHFCLMNHECSPQLEQPLPPTNQALSELFFKTDEFARLNKDIFVLFFTFDAPPEYL
jgi:hypothetical protein